MSPGIGNSRDEELKAPCGSFDWVGAVVAPWTNSCNYSLER